MGLKATNQQDRYRDQIKNVMGIEIMGSVGLSTDHQSFLRWRLRAEDEFSRLAWLLPMERPSPRKCSWARRLHRRPSRLRTCSCRIGKAGKRIIDEVEKRNHLLRVDLLNEFGSAVESVGQTADSVDEGLFWAENRSVVGSGNRNIVVDEMVDRASKVDSAVDAVTSEDGLSGDRRTHGARDDVHRLLGVLVDCEDQRPDLKQTICLMICDVICLIRFDYCSDVFSLFSPRFLIYPHRRKPQKNQSFVFCVAATGAFCSLSTHPFSGHPTPFPSRRHLALSIGLERSPTAVTSLAPIKRFYCQVTAKVVQRHDHHKLHIHYKRRRQNGDINWYEDDNWMISATPEPWLFVIPWARSRIAFRAATSPSAFLWRRSSRRRFPSAVHMSSTCSEGFSLTARHSQPVRVPQQSASPCKEETLNRRSELVRGRRTLIRNRWKGVLLQRDTWRHCGELGHKPQLGEPTPLRSLSNSEQITGGYTNGQTEVKWWDNLVVRTLQNSRSWTILRGNL